MFRPSPDVFSSQVHLVCTSASAKALPMSAKAFAAEIVVAGVGCAAFPQRFFCGRNEFSLELLHGLLLLCVGHLAVGIRMDFVLRVKEAAHLPHLVAFLVYRVMWF